MSRGRKKKVPLNNEELILLSDEDNINDKKDIPLPERNFKIGKKITYIDTAGHKEEVINVVGYDENNKTIIIHFEEIFGRKDITQHNIFKINKRSLFKSFDLLADDLNFIINKCPSYITNLLKLKIKITESINTKRIYSIDEFYDDIVKRIVKDKNLLDIISDLVEKEYTLTLDENAKTKTINTELQVTDSLNKTWLKSSILIRMVTPLICTFAEKNSINKRIQDNLDSLMFNIFKRCIDIFNTNNTDDIYKTNALNKLNKIISSRVSQTKYSDIVIWRYLQNMATDDKIVEQRFFKYIIRNIFPKLNHNTSVISYIDVVIRYKLKFLFTFNYPINYKPLKIEVSNDDDLSEQEKMEINMLRPDIGEFIINECSIEQEVNKIKNKYDISDNDFENGELNSFQLYFLRMYYSDKLIINDNVLAIKYLLFNMIQELIDLQFALLPLILDSNISKNTKRNNNQKKLMDKVIESNKYKKLMNEFDFISDLFDRNNVVLSIMTIKNYKFLDDNENEIDVPIEKISEEILDFLFCWK